MTDKVDKDRIQALERRVRRLEETVKRLEAAKSDVGHGHRTSGVLYAVGRPLPSDGVFVPSVDGRGGR